MFLSQLCNTTLDSFSEHLLANLPFVTFSLCAESAAAVCTYTNRLEQSGAVIWLRNEHSRFIPEVSRCSNKSAEAQDFIIQLSCVCVYQPCVLCLVALVEDLSWIKACTDLLSYYLDTDKLNS